ncbi:MAG: SsrA-binding protein SmpB [Actinomycetota bacterium]
MADKKKKSAKPANVATNRKARFEYSIEETYECGIALQGSEVKSMRDGKANLTEAYAAVRENEIWLIGANVAPYTQASWQNHEPTRARKLLLHRKEIAKIASKIAEQGLTLVPLRLYFKDNIIKCEIGVARGKKTHDKRASIASRDAEREMRKREGALRRSRG